ncbi:MAG TPA: hypothetical protein VHO06_00405 [Polyangia bacterium]|nr:hypothetical protein [Polyangia bacterium]
MQDEREHQLGDRLGRVAGDVADRDPRRARRLEVDDVGPRRRHADVAERGERRQLAGAERGLVGQHRQRVRAAGHDLAGLALRVDDQLTERRQLAPGGLRLSLIDGEAVEDDDAR